MRSCLSVFAFLLLVALPTGYLSAQTPRGWMMRADNSASASDPDAPGDITFVATGSGFHAVDPRAAVFWNPANRAGGSYMLKGTFTLLKPSNHTNYYGLVLGGSNLDGPAQRYVYFLVAQDGTWIVKRRDGDATTRTIFPATASAAIRKPDASGRSVNSLEVRVSDSVIDFAVNGTIVNRWVHAARAIATEGIYGIRVNHFLDVQIDGLGAMPAPNRPGPSSGTSPDAEHVAFTAAVNRMWSPGAFSLKADADVPGTFVVAPTLQRPLESGSAVTVFGRETLDAAVPPDVAQQFRGRPALVASVVLDAAMVDLTKPLPPPVTPEEERLDAIMKRIAPAFAGLRRAVDLSNIDEAKQQGAALSHAFADVEAFWSAKAITDATTWAHDARTAAESIAGAGSSEDAGRVSTGFATLGRQCQSCHAAHRVQFANGEFRIKR